MENLDRKLNLLKEYVKDFRDIKRKYNVNDVWVDLDSPDVECLIAYLPIIKKLTKMNIHFKYGDDLFDKCPVPIKQ